MARSLMPKVTMTPSNLLTSTTLTARILLVALLFLAFAQHIDAFPTTPPLRTLVEDVPAKPADDPGLWVFLGSALGLVLLGGVFAGLTIAYVFQDDSYASKAL